MRGRKRGAGQRHEGLKTVEEHLQTRFGHSKSLQDGHAIASPVDDLYMIRVKALMNNSMSQ